jgi:16S rRNA (guanine966-N2)-methyltransferase
MEVLARMEATRYDLVLLDPPFGQGWLARIWPLLPGILHDGGLVYVESETDIQPSELAAPAEGPDQAQQFETLRKDRAGAVHYMLLRFAALRK